MRLCLLFLYIIEMNMKIYRIFMRLLNQYTKHAPTFPIYIKIFFQSSPFLISLIYFNIIVHTSIKPTNKK